MPSEWPFGPVALEVRALSGPAGGVVRYIQGLLTGLKTVCPTLPLILLTDRRQELPTARSAAKAASAQGGPALLPVPPSGAAFRFVWDAIALPAAVRRLRPTLLHRTKPAFVPHRRGFPPTVITVYDMIPLEYPETQTIAQRTYWRVSLPLAARSATHILTISEASKRAILNRLGVPPERVTVTLPGLDPSFVPPAPDTVTALRNRLRLQRPYVLTVGTIEPRKNIDRLLRAFAQIVEEFPHTLVIAGRWGWKTHAVTAAAADPRLRGRVLFLGHVPAPDLPALYGGADAFVCVSRAEGFGFPPLEAQACGTPVIVSDRGSLPEAVGSAAILVDPDNEAGVAAELRRLLSNRALQEDLRRRGREWAQRFSWNRMASQTLEVYERVAAL